MQNVFRATLTISWLINGAYGNYWWNVNETTVYVLVHVTSTAHPDIQHGDTLTYDVNVAYGGTSDLTGTVTLTYSTDEPTNSAVSDVSTHPKRCQRAVQFTSNILIVLSTVVFQMVTVVWFPGRRSCERDVDPAS